MKEIIFATLAVTSTTATGALLLITGGQVGFALVAQQAIGPATPIAGITVAVVGAGIVAGITFLWQGAKHMIALGKYIASLTAALDMSKQTAEVGRATAELLGETVKRLEAIDGRVAALEVRSREVDPIIAELQIRAGLRARPGERHGTA